MITRLESPAEVSTRIEDVRVLRLPEALEKSIEKIVYENRLEWELWLETKNSYEELRKSLYARGVSNVSANPAPMVTEFQLHKIEEKQVEKKTTMIQRGKR